MTVTIVYHSISCDQWCMVGCCRTLHCHPTLLTFSAVLPFHRLWLGGEGLLLNLLIVDHTQTQHFVQISQPCLAVSPHRLHILAAVTTSERRSHFDAPMMPLWDDEAQRALIEHGCVKGAGADSRWLIWEVWVSKYPNVGAHTWLTTWIAGGQGLK